MRTSLPLLRTGWRLAGLLAMLVLLLCGPVQAALAAQAAAEPASLQLTPCRLKGVAHEARCGVLKRPLDPSQPQGRQIDLHVAVLPAIARHRKPDPVLFLAGGPGQSAIELAGPISRMMGRFQNRRDVLLIDQRGTGQSAALRCDDEAPGRSLRDSTDPVSTAQQLQACRTRLMALPHGDLRQYTTVIASADIEAVRRALGLGSLNVIGASYGTRAALDYARQYPASVRRMVLDGVAPPDMALPIAFSTDGQAALDAVWADCEASTACLQRYPRLRADWKALMASLPKEVSAPHPLTGQLESVTLTRATLVSLVRMPLYTSLTASALPMAITEAAAGRYTALFGLGLGSLGGSRAMKLATGMHFSVVCAEDLPRLARSQDAPGADMGTAMVDLYREACAGWPAGTVPEAFYSVPPTQAGSLLLSGMLDPVTPPRHGERVAQALGPQAVHVMVPNTGHGVMGSVPCLRDAVYRFVDTELQAEALSRARSDAACAANVPRPPALQAFETGARP